jgi:outer membrane protein assembly complex protein YaeT
MLSAAIFCALTATAQVGVAQLAPMAGPGPVASLAGEKIVAVYVDGVSGAATDSALAVFGLAAGDTLDPTAVRLGIKRVYLTGPWADVRVYASRVTGGLALTLVLLPDRVVGSIDIDAQGAIPEGRLRPALGLRLGDRFRENQLQEAADNLAAAAGALGYPRATVRFEVEARGGAEHRVRFFLDPGAPTLVRTLKVVGDARMSADRVARVIGTQRGVPFSRMRVEQGLSRLLERLREHRHLDARAEVADIHIDANGFEVDVVIRVEAGPRYRVSFAGTDALARGELRGVANETTLAGTDRASLERASTRIEEVYARAGFARARVRAEVRPAGKDDDADRVVRFVVDEGPLVLVREIHVEGPKARTGFELANEIWRFVRAEAPRPGLLGRVDRGDVEELLETPSGAAREPRKEWIDRDRITFFRPEEYGGGFTLLPMGVVEPPYLEQLFRNAGGYIANKYRKEGYLDVRVEGPEPIWLKNGAEVRLRYRVHEGEQLNVGVVKFEPAPSVPVAELLTDTTLEPGGPLDLYAVEEARVRIEARLRDRGYPFARATERFVRGEPGVADIVFAVDEGQLVHVDQIRVRGNVRTKDFVILDRAQLKPGELYRASRIARARAALLRMGLFTSVSIALLDDVKDAKRRDVVIEVRERPRYSIEAGGGASLEDGPRAFSVLEARNVFGFGLGGRVRAQVNYPALLYDLIYDETDENTPRKRIESLERSALETGLLFTEGQLVVTGEMPRVYGLPFDARLHIDAIGLREIRPAFTLMKGSVLMGLDTQPARRLRIEPQVEAETSDFDCPTGLVVGTSCGQQTSGLTRRQDAGQISQLSFRLLSSLDLRDDPFRPHSGFFGSLTTDIAGGVGSLREASTKEAQAVVSNFVKVAGVVSGYVPLAPEFTLALSLRGGNIFPLGDDPNLYIPLYKRFYLGGTGSVRGFREDQILPVDDADWPATQRDKPRFVAPARSDELTYQGPELSTTSLGGNFFFNMRAELRMATFGEVEFGTFVDAGQLALDVTNVQLAGLAIGTGVGFRYNTPVGPLALDVGWQVIDGQRALAPLGTFRDRWNIHLAIGYF